jgi:hypothetical protein
MYGIKTHCRERYIVVPKAERLKPRINEAFVGRNRRGQTCAACAVEAYCAIGCYVSAVRSHSLHVRLASANVRYGTSAGERFSQGLGHCSNRPFVESGIAHGSRGMASAQQFLSGQIHDWRVVLVHGREQDSLGLGSGGFGQRGLPSSVGVVADFAPVDGHEYDRFAIANQHKTIRFEWVGDSRRTPCPAHHSMPQWDCDISAENGKTQSRRIVATRRCQRG